MVYLFRTLKKTLAPQRFQALFFAFCYTRHNKGISEITGSHPPIQTILPYLQPITLPSGE